MKEFLIALGISLFCIGVAVACAQESTYERNGNNFTKVVTVTQSTDVLTPYTYTVKDMVYPIYITKNGRCYVVRISKNGNQYRQYLEKDICLQICKEMGIEYKEQINKE